VNITSDEIQTIVQQVVKNVMKQEVLPTVKKAGKANGDWGVFDDMNDAVQAAHEAFLEYQDRCDIQCRKKFTDALRQMTLDHKEEFSRLTVEETGMGRIEHKIQKHINVAKNSPGVEYLQPHAWSGQNGLAIDEFSPYGVIGNITPSTHPVPTMVNNMIIQLAAGNTIAFNPHPAAKRVNAYCVKLANQYMVKAGAPENLVTCVAEPTLDSADILFKHPLVEFLSVTGGPVMVDMAMKYPKKIIAAGPGNPPVLIDETANLELAAKEITMSASFDNNILCIAEKEIFVVDSVFEKFMKAFEKQGNVRLTTVQINQLAQKALVKSGKHWIIHRDYVGKNANVLAKALGKHIPETVPLLFGETDKDHPWVVAEQMTSCVPVIRVKDFEAGVEAAMKAEHGFKHTASIFTQDMNRATIYTRKLNCDVHAINGGTLRANGGDLGEAYFSHTIATPTGEGICTPLHFTRKRRIMIAGAMRFA
jgi:acyl-CoA reductase-like NAD-dependent aldehyde dehydrogenase